jgi:hypothetical protein
MKKGKIKKKEEKKKRKEKERDISVSLRMRYKYYNTCAGVSGVRKPLSVTRCIAISNASSPVMADPSRIFMLATSQGDRGCRNATG